jgi:pilus assembly protein Flp/PilA
MVKPFVSRRQRRQGRGQGLVEYALIIALVAIVVIAILVIMGPQIGDIFSNITNGL